LRNLEKSAADPETVSDTDFSVRQPVHRKVFSKLSVGEIIAAEFSFPKLVGIQLIDHDGPVQSTMACQVSLSVTVDVKATDHYPSVRWIFPYACVDGLAIPGDVTRETDIY
jgi:hypothetical protein